MVGAFSKPETHRSVSLQNLCLIYKFTLHITSFLMKNIKYFKRLNNGVMCIETLSRATCFREKGGLNWMGFKYGKHKRTEIKIKKAKMEGNFRDSQVSLRVALHDYDSELNRQFHLFVRDRI